MASIAPVSFRLADSDIALIDRAARLLGRSRTEFVRDVAVREAERTVMDAHVVRLMPDDFAKLEAHLDNPGEPNAALRRLMAGYAAEN